MPIQYFSDAERSFYSRPVYPTEPMGEIEKLTVADAPTARNFMGFGVAITASSCYCLSQMEPAERTALLKRIYTKEGLNLSIGRVSIGASDYSPELYSYDDTPGDLALEHFSVARDEAYVIPMIKEILAIRPDLHLLASPWSPPGWMKTGGLMCGGHMREQFAECYARYTVKFIKAYAAHGIKISAITPQNEPETQQDGKMPACLWSPDTEAAYVKALRPLLKKEGLDVKIWIWDHNFIGASRVDWMLDTIDGLKDDCDGIAFHYYKGSVEQTAFLREKYGLALHFTEAGPRLNDNYDTDWCKWGIMISKALACGYSSFNGWNLMLDEMGGPNIGPFLCGGLVTRNSVTGELRMSGQYKAFAHIAPYLTPDAEVYPVLTDKPARNMMYKFPKTKEPLAGFMIDRKDGKPVFVLINFNKDKVQAQLPANGKLWYLELLPESISTIVFD